MPTHSSAWTPPTSSPTRKNYKPKPSATPFSFVIAQNADEARELLSTLEGNLTGTIYSATNGEDDALYGPLAATLRFPASAACSTTRCPPASPSAPP